MPPEQAIRIALEHHQAGRLASADAIYQQVLVDHPAHANALYLSGLIAGQLGQLNRATDLLRRAVDAAPTRPEFWLQYGIALRSSRNIPLAIASFERAVALKPGDPQLHYILANALQSVGQFERSIVSYQRALEIKPDYADAVGNLGSAYKETGQLDRAIDCYRRAVELKPDAIITRDNLLLALLYHPATTPETLFIEGEKWSDQHEKPLAHFIKPPTNNRDPDRPLRIGYVSPDFANHPIGRFMLPLLMNQDRDQFQTYCYSQIQHPDDMTTRLQKHADVWRTIFPLTDDQVAESIRQDQIDILVNLAMHTAKNRLLVFARKPAPIQVVYLGYAGGCAVKSIDYRLTDQHMDPDEAEDHCYQQKAVRLSGSYWCYQQTIADVPVSASPASSNHYMTFGCLNNFSKITDATLELWVKVLIRLPISKLLMHAPAGGHRDRLLQFFQSRGINADRLEFIDRVAPDTYLQTYHRIDIALDPTPYAGGTTTCDALWMGVPVITLAGRLPIARAGVSILSSAGLTEWIARTSEEYVELAVSLAADLPELAVIRSTLRQKLQHSNLMDVVGYARSIETAYRTMWRRWCRQ
jgi:predicted O-linked N-acetylglucosamine transferase (SPINDLY family)